MRTRAESTHRGENKNQHQFTQAKAKSSTGFMAELEAWAEDTIYKPAEDAFNRGDYKTLVKPINHNSIKI